MVLAAGASFTVRRQILESPFFSGPTLYNNPRSPKSQPDHLEEFRSSASMSNNETAHSADAAAPVSCTHFSICAPSNAQHVHETNMLRPLQETDIHNVWIQNIRANWGPDTKAWFPEDCHPTIPDPKDWAIELVKRLSDLSILSGAGGREFAVGLIKDAILKREGKTVGRQTPLSRDIRHAMTAYSAFVVNGGSQSNVVGSAQSIHMGNDAASAQSTNGDTVVDASAPSSTADSSRRRDWLEPIADEDRAQFNRLVNLVNGDVPKKMAPSATNLLPFYPEAVARAYVNAGTRGAAFNQPKKGATIMTPEIAQLGPYHGSKNSTGPYVTTEAPHKNIANAEENEKAIIYLEKTFHACLASILQDPKLKATEIFRLPTDILCRLATIVEDNGITSLLTFQGLLERTLRNATSIRPVAWPNGRKPDLSIANVRQLQINMDRHGEEILEELEKAKNEGTTMIVKLKAPSAFLQGLSSTDEAAEDSNASDRPSSSLQPTGDAPTHPQPENGEFTPQEQEEANQEVTGAASKGDTEEDAIMINSSDSDDSSKDSDSNKPGDNPTASPSTPHGLRRYSHSPSDPPTHSSSQQRPLEEEDDIQDLLRSDPVFAQHMQQAQALNTKFSACVTAAHALIARSARLADELAIAQRELAHRSQELAGANHDNGRLRDQNRVLQEQHAREMRWRQGQVERAEEQRAVAERERVVAERDRAAAREHVANWERWAEAQQQEEAYRQLADSVGRLTNANAELAMATHQAQNTITGLQVENRRLAEENARLRALAMGNVLGGNQVPGGNAGHQAQGGNGV